jgi:hypothetical protein
MWSRDYFHETPGFFVTLTSRKASVAGRDFLKGAAAGAELFVASPAFSEAHETAPTSSQQAVAAAKGNPVERKGRIRLAARMR